MNGVRIAPAIVPDDVHVAREMFREYERDIGVDLCFQGFEDELAGLPGRYAPPRGALLLARVEPTGAVAGCVALRDLGDGTCEMKRMYVRPSHRGTGLGRRLAVAIIEEARRIGYRAMVLDTLPHLTQALGLYRSLGFSDTAAYTPNPLEGVVYLELKL